jgi:hypothetical protein
MYVFVDVTAYAFIIPETTEWISAIRGFGACTEILQASFIMFLGLSVGFKLCCAQHYDRT